MRVLKEIKNIIVSGVRTMFQASRGQYGSQSSEIQKIREELFNAPSTPVDDMRNLNGDRQKIYHDIRVSFNQNYNK